MLPCSSASDCRITATPATGTAPSASREHCSCACVCPSLRGVRACVRPFVHAHACVEGVGGDNVALRAPKPRRVKSKRKCKSSASYRARGAPPAPRHHCPCRNAHARMCAASGQNHRVGTDMADIHGGRGGRGGDSPSFADITPPPGVRHPRSAASCAGFGSTVANAGLRE